LFVLAVAIGLLIVVTRVFGASSSHKGAAATPPARKHASPLRIDAANAAALLPDPLSRAVAITNGSSVVVAGGIDAGQATTANVMSISPSSPPTTDGALSVPTHDAAAAMVRGSALVFGGGAQQVSDVVQELAPGGSSRVIAHLPRPRADFSAVTIGATVYLVGGYDGTTTDGAVLATKDGVTYHTVANLPVPVRYPAVATANGKIYVFGGKSNGAITSAIQMVDPATRRAVQIGRLPAPRTEAAGFTLAGLAYVAGGRTSAGPSSDILRFDPARASLARVGSLPEPLADAAPVVVARSVYLVGGEASSPTSSFVVLRPTATSLASHLAWSRQRPFAGLLLIADRGNNRLIVVDASKHLLWSYPSPTKPAPPGGFYFPDDGFFVDHGRTLLTNEEENHTIVRIAYPSGTVQWSYGHPRSPGAAEGYLNQPDDAFVLRDGVTTVADAKNCRILFLSPSARPVGQIGTTGNCVHDPPRSLGYPNGDTPLADGNLLISEINGSWISEYTRTAHLVWTVHLPITYPSDPQQIGPDLYLVADYARPGGIVEFTREGRIVWSYRPTSGDGMLDHPSLAELLDNGLIGVNDDYRHRVALIDPATQQIVWQYGATDQPGTGFDRVNTPDGFDLLLPDATTPGHPHTA
jgi:outer membrane protein assembly factor BamB